MASALYRFCIAICMVFKGTLVDFAYCCHICFGSPVVCIVNSCTYRVCFCFICFQKLSATELQRCEAAKFILFPLKLYTTEEGDDGNNSFFHFALGVIDRECAASFFLLFLLFPSVLSSCSVAHFMLVLSPPPSRLLLFLYALPSPNDLD